MRKSLGIPGLLATALFVLGLTGSALAVAPKEARHDLDRLEFYRPDLHLSTSHVPFEQVQGQLGNREAWARFFAENGNDFRVFLDPRSGAPTNILGRVAMLPGRGVGNDVTLARLSTLLGRPVTQVDAGVVADLLRRFVVRNADVLAVDPAQLGAVTAAKVNDELWNVSIRQERDGVPVRWGRLVATINNGNLVTIGTETWGNARVDTTPKLDPEQALKAGFAYAGGELPGDKLLGPPRLEVVPFAPAALQDGEAYAGPLGAGYGHRLAWTYSFRRSGVVGTWQVSVDAHTGEVLELKDTNHYAKKKVVGGVYPLTNTDICPDLQRCGTMQTGSPMPFTNTGFPAPNDLTNSAGLYEYATGSVLTTLAGKYVRISDTCGAISETSATGDLDLGGANGQHDCAVGGASAGDTPSSRSAFFELNKLIEQARGWLPNNTWLQSQLPCNVNLNSTCNAYYDYTSVNFYRSGGGCRNTGENAAVFDHEWGHGMDDNDTGGAMSVTSESYADIAAIYRLQASCVGYGFWWTNDKGCGQTSDGTGFNGNNAQTGAAVCELDCSGVRGADYARIAGNTPHTPQNFSCVSCNSGSGPCGREVHCDARPATEAAWDFAARDLQGGAFNYDATTAFMIANKVFYQGSGNVGSWHSCSCPGTSDGCGSTNAYMQWLAADDDNGNVNDGTPHMTALYAAFARHNIACATPAPVNSGCSGGPTGVPTVTVAPGSNQVVLTWTAVPGASRYWVLRSEGFAGCNFGKALIATVTGTSYTDAQVANGLTYAYNVVAVGSSDACFGRASACVTATPQPCAGSLSLDKSVYNCTDSVAIVLVDSDLSGTGTQAVAVSSTTEAAPESVVLSESPAGSGQFQGTIATTPGPVVPGDGVLSVANGDTLTGRYVDASYCGEPNVPVTATAPVDCAAPVIGNVFADNVTGSLALIHWTTDEPSDSVVHYGRSLPLGSTTSDAVLATAHAVQLSQLAECSTYYYSVASTDPAGNAAASDNGGQYYTFQTGKNVNPSYAATDVPVAIPDNSPVGASSTIAVADTNVVLDVNVTANIAHTYDGDITLYLVGPDGQQVTLSARHGSSGDNYTGTVFDDEAATPVASGTAPFTGSFRPDTPLSVFDNLPATGSWTLKVVDSAGSDTGQILGWTLSLTYPAEDCGATLRLDRDVYTCSSTTGISVKDTTLAGQPSLTVTVASETETTPETVTLLARPAPQEDTFDGSIPLTAGAPAHGDGLLSVADGNTVTVTYVDADDGMGHHDVVHTDTARVDCVRAAISSVYAGPVGSSTATINWSTNENANSVVHYGPAIPPAATTSAAPLVTAHAVPLAGLLECTTYYYDVASTDEAGNVATDNNAGQYFTFTTQKNVSPSYGSTDTPVSIPDNNAAGATSTINVVETNAVQDVNVTVNITHTYDGDIALYLVAPNGTQVTLSSRHGSSGDNYTNTVFDDAAATPVANGSAPFTGAFRPDTPLSALNGIPAAGAWQLKVVDSASSDTGTIVNWTLQLTYPSGACGASANYQSSTVADSCLAGGTHGGDGVIDRGEDVVSQITLRNTGTVPLTNVSAVLSTSTPGVTVTRATATYPSIPVGGSAASAAPHFAYAVGPTVPCGSEITFGLRILTAQGTFSDSFKVRVGAAGTGATTYPSTDVPKPIPDNSTTGATSNVVVTDPAPITKVRVTTNITHTWDGDITLTLVAPNGTQVTLSARHGSSGDNYTNTVFDDAAATPIASGSPPYTGSFKPDSPLSALNGLPGNGTWGLKVVDAASGDTGTITAWSLELTKDAGYVCNDCGTAVPSGEPVTQAWVGRTGQQWEAIAGASFYNLYRGTGPALKDLVTPAPDSCLRLSTTSTSTGPVLTEDPAAGGVYWYLVRAANPAGEGPAGSASSGPRQQQSTGSCP